MTLKTLPVVVWDVDDVLNSLMQSWFEQRWLATHPECKLHYEDIVENPPHQILGISLEDYLISLDEFRLSGQYRQLPPREDIHVWFQKFGYRYRHVALTATPLRAAAKSSEWVINHFGQWIRSFNFVPSARKNEMLPVYDKTKGEFLNWWNKADVLVDDSAANIEAATVMGMRAVLMPQPWNESRLTVGQTLDLLASLAQGAGPS